MNTPRLSAIALFAALALAACGGSDDADSTAETSAQEDSPGTEQPGDGQGPDDDPGSGESSFTVGLLPDTQGGGDNVSVHPMKAVMDRFQEMGVDLVIPVGDLTDHGTTREFEQWTGVAEPYRDAGMEFMPLMGNHEDSYAYTVEWIDNMRHYIPEDAVHMTGAEWLDYYVVRENVLLIALRYYHLPVAFQWIKGVVEQHRDEVDHIVIASHDGLIGAKYGETREMIVEGTKGDNQLMHQWDEIRAFFSRHDVIWVQGHEHMYQRSVITAPVGVDARSWTPDSGNYRLPQYTQIMSGNASYKGYEFRYGERELVQRIVAQKMNTMENGSTAFDANASVLTFDGDRVDYESYFTEHTVTDNEDGTRELENPDWRLLDQFSRTTNRCERIVYPNSIPEGTRPVMVLDPQYWTNECVAEDGTVARLIDGVNDTFNRVESTTRTMGITPGFSRAETRMGLVRLGYQYLFQYHQRWSPNLNGADRQVPSEDNDTEVVIPETTIDLKEHLTLSWTAATQNTVSDILIVSGTQNQTGMYQSAYGMPKDIETDEGLPASQPDGTAKQPVSLPATASQEWDLATAVSDAYTLQFTAPESVDRQEVALARRTANGWEPMADSECVLEQPYTEGMLSNPPARSASCEGQPLVGYDAGYGNRWWAVVDSDVEMALIPVD